MLRRLHAIVIALLLFTLPVMGLAGFAREAQAGCAMQMHGEHGGMAMKMSAHCKAMAHAARMACKRGAHCSMCDDLSASPAVTSLSMATPVAAQGITLTPSDFLLDTTVASLWRPPRSV